jgi:UDP:flavonoid glycosyltransferase YjiC (YdhE family)
MECEADINNSFKGAYVKPRILCFPWSGGLARTSRLLSVALYLREKGAEVAFAGDGRYVCGKNSIVKPEGFETFPLPDIPPEVALIGNTLKFYSGDMVERFVEAELALIKEWKPDAVLLDFRATAALSSRIAGVPSFALSLLDNTRYTARRISAPVDHPKNLKVQKWLGPKLGRRFADWVAPFFMRFEMRDAALPLDRVARKYGIPERRNFFSWLEGSELNFITDVPGWSPSRKLPSRFHYSGPIVWNPKGFETEWEELRKRIPRDRKFVYISFGSTGREDVFLALLDAVRDRPEFFLVTTGGQISLPDLPPNMLSAEFLPGQKVMEEADAVVCHGGSGTLFQAVEAGKPVYAIAMRADQEWNAKEVARFHLGIATTARAVLKDHARFGRDLERLLTDGIYREGVKQFQEKLKEFSGSRKIADEMMEHMARAKK